jgi:uncharacterized protein with HEPN domain
MRDDRMRLADIIDAIAQIEKYTGGDKASFSHDERTEVWCLHHLQIIGEALAQMSQTFRAAHPEFPWRPAVGMRNILVHGYFEVDMEAVWEAVEHDLPPLKQQAEAALRADTGGT